MDRAVAELLLKIESNPKEIPPPPSEPPEKRER
jgi:hypothetical protein